jgi:hypothetical protein
VQLAGLLVPHLDTPSGISDKQSAAMKRAPTTIPQLRIVGITIILSITTITIVIHNVIIIMIIITIAITIMTHPVTSLSLPVVGSSYTTRYFTA